MTRQQPQPTIRQLLQRADNESAGGRPDAVLFHVNAAERALLKETAYKARTSQAGVLRTGLRLVARDLALEDEQ